MSSPYTNVSRPSPRPSPSSPRPSTVAELSERALYNLWDPSKSLKQWLISADGMRNAGRAFAEAGELEEAFMEYAKSVTIILEKLPMHKDYYTLLSPTQRHNLTVNGHQILLDLEKITLSLINRYEQWRLQNTETNRPSINDLAEGSRHTEYRRHDDGRRSPYDVYGWLAQNAVRTDTERRREEQRVRDEAPYSIRSIDTQPPHLQIDTENKRSGVALAATRRAANAQLCGSAYYSREGVPSDPVSPVSPEDRRFSCAICMDEHPMDNIIELDCNHQICRDGIRGHIRAKIEERRFPVFCPSCMVGQCNRPTVIEGRHIQLIGVTEREYAIWEEMELNQHSVLIHCCRCRRSVWVDKVDHEESEVLRCPLPNCNHSWCKLCQQSIDLGGPPHSCDGTTELHHLVQQQGWKYCPNCNIPVERDGGCCHMSCRCNTHFCYGCGQCIIRSTLQSEIDDAVHTHYHSGPCQMFEHDGTNDLEHEVEDDEGVDSEGHGTEDLDGRSNEDPDGHGVEDSDGHGVEDSDGHGNEDLERHGTGDSNCCCIS